MKLLKCLSIMLAFLVAACSGSEETQMADYLKKSPDHAPYADCLAKVISENATSEQMKKWSKSIKQGKIIADLSFGELISMYATQCVQ